MTSNTNWERACYRDRGFPLQRYRCVQKKSLSAHFLDPEKADALCGQIEKVLNPDWGQRGGCWNIDGHELDNLIAKWLEKDSLHTNSARRIQIWAPKIIRMAVCRNLENLEHITSNRKSVLRARRTRRPKMAKRYNFQNWNRYDQNVGKVLISRNMTLTSCKRQFWAKTSFISFFLNSWTQWGGPPSGPLFGRQFFFSHTGMLLMSK